MAGTRTFRFHVRATALDHALTLARQIDFLGGVPSTRTPDAERKEDPRAALEQDLALEEGQLRRYRERVEQANELGLPDLAETIAPLLSQTQEHARDLRAALGSHIDPRPRVRSSADLKTSTSRRLAGGGRRLGPGATASTQLDRRARSVAAASGREQSSASNTNTSGSSRAQT
jgi:Ferritin-like domain